MNRFDERYDIRLASYDEIPEVMKFIDDHWKKGHILAVNRDFFEYEMVVDGVVDFLIAKDKATGKIDGIIGFLPCSHDKERLDIWGVIWKTIDGAMPMLGMELKKRLMTILNARTDLGVGANSGTSVPLLSRISHFYTAKMRHYYILSDSLEYKIAKVITVPDSVESSNWRTNTSKLNSIEELAEFFDFESVKDVIPYKDAWYYNRRYYQHPIYKYDIWGLSHDDKKAIIVTREQPYNNSRALRIVDYLGDQSLFSGCNLFLREFLQDNEYVDFYFDGFDEKYAEDAGMTNVDDTPDNIIPDYFHPFEQVNVDIWVDSSEKTKKCTFFKADGDQDRPN